jgi:putative NADH-flavin reductase
MKIALFGASGMIGSRILREAVSRGHDVTAIARNASRILERGVHVHPVVANILDLDSVRAAVEGHHAAVSAFGPGPDQPPESIVQAARTLIQGCRLTGVRRVVWIGGAGSLEAAPGVQLVDTPQFPAEWKPIALAHRDALNVFRNEAADLEWTYVSPPALIGPGERTEKYRIGGDQLLVDEKGESRISAEDFAIAIMDELENPRHVRSRMTIAN